MVKTTQRHSPNHFEYGERTCRLPGSPKKAEKEDFLQTFSIDDADKKNFMQDKSWINRTTPICSISKSSGPREFLTDDQELALLAKLNCEAFQKDQIGDKCRTAKRHFWVIIKTLNLVDSAFPASNNAYEAFILSQGDNLYKKNNQLIKILKTCDKELMRDSFEKIFGHPCQEGAVKPLLKMSIVEFPYFFKKNFKNLFNEAIQIAHSEDFAKILEKTPRLITEKFNITHLDDQTPIQSIFSLENFRTMQLIVKEWNAFQNKKNELISTAQISSSSLESECRESSDFSNTPPMIEIFPGQEAISRYRCLLPSQEKDSQFAPALISSKEKTTLLNVMGRSSFAKDHEYGDKTMTLNSSSTASIQNKSLSESLGIFWPVKPLPKPKKRLIVQSNQLDSELIPSLYSHPHTTVFLGCVSFCPFIIPSSGQEKSSLQKERGESSLMGSIYHRNHPLGQLETYKSLQQTLTMINQPESYLPLDQEISLNDAEKEPSLPIQKDLSHVVSERVVYEKTVYHYNK